MLKSAIDAEPNGFVGRNVILPEQTAKRLIQILIENKFSSGEQIHY
jgi:hypothetical protein